MRKLDRLILRSFIGPLALTFTIAVFVLLMQFVWKYIDDMVGKGLEFSIIAELLAYASATFVPMALPIAVLFASIMTMGNFGERYELVAMKAGGISVSRVMAPMMVVVLLLTGVAFYFANNVMPTAMLKYRMTLYDITRKKPAVNIRPGEYYKDIDGYVIRVGEKDNDTGIMDDITIYDHSKGIGETSVIVAKRGEMVTSTDDRYLTFTLFDGYSYTESATGENYQKRPFTTIGFDRQVITFDISSFALNRSSEDIFKGSYQMMNITQLDTTVARLRKQLNTRKNNGQADIENNLHAWHLYSGNAPRIDTVFNPQFVKTPRDVSKNQRNYSYNCVNTAVKDIRANIELQTADQEYINRHIIEMHRKFTLSIACLLLFLVGAPFGSIVRKGGLGMPLVASVLFFVLYYVIGMIAEKAVRESAIGPIGMWFSSFAMLPIGIVLTIQATTDSSFFDSASWKRFFLKLLQRKKQNPPQYEGNT